MCDEIDRLRGAKELQALLRHYRDLGAADRTAWQDRLCARDGLEPRDLVRLHGELIAFGWVEQNTGVVFGARYGTAPACYRITPAGLRALKQLTVVDQVSAEREARSAAPRSPYWHSCRGMSRIE